MQGGKRKGAGRKAGSTTTDNVKLGISISRKNAEWLKRQKLQGKSISWHIDKAVSSLKKCEACKYGYDCAFKMAVFEKCLEEIGLL